MRRHRSLLLAGCTTLALACGGGSSGSGPTFKVYGSAVAPAGVHAQMAPWTGAGSITSLKQTFYAAWVSESADCSSPIPLADHGAAGMQFDFFDHPTLFESSAVPDGTYPCVIVKVSDTQTFKPDAAAETAHGATCTAGQAYQFDTFRAGANDRVTIDGSTESGEGTVTEPVAQEVYAFFSTDPSAVTADSSQKLQLASPLVIPGQATFYEDFTDRVSETDTGQCWMEPGVVGFE